MDALGSLLHEVPPTCPGGGAFDGGAGLPADLVLVDRVRVQGVQPQLALVSHIRYPGVVYDAAAYLRGFKGSVVLMNFTTV